MCEVCYDLGGGCFRCVVVVMWCEEGFGSGKRCSDPPLVSFATASMLSPCHRQPPYYGLGCGSTSNRRRCPCCVVGFHLHLDLCLCGCLFHGEDVVRRSDIVIVEVMRSGDSVAVGFFLG
jgi:hypothetical protein